MNVKEMQAAAVMQLQLISKELEIVEKPDSYTLLYFLNLSQLQYIITNFLNKGQVSDNIEAIHRRSDILRNLIKRYEGTESPAAIPASDSIGSIKLDLPSDYLYYMSSFSFIENPYTTFGGKNWVPNRIVDHQELYKIINSGFNSPILRRPCVVLEEANKAVLYKDRDTSVFNISYVYLRKPLEMSLDATSNNVPTGKTNECELDESTHMDIVNNAVQMFITDYKYKLTTRQ